MISQQRYQAIDVLRGLTVTLMIIVNTPGSWETSYAPLEHAQWNGFTPTDWVFPTFLFVVGNAMSFSLLKYADQGNTAFLRKVIKRSLLIFLCGYFLYWFPFVEYGPDGNIVLSPFSGTRVFGVLQRIAISYLFASLILHYGKDRGALWFCVVALVGYRVILGLFGDLTLEGNAVLRLDRWLVGENHMYHGEGIAFDPEGLLSTLPAIVNVIAGYWAGRFIQQKGNTYETIAKLMVAGTILIFVALCWDIYFPINKKLWTSSYVLYTVGIDLLMLSVLIYAIEMLGFRRWAYFFEVFGKNTLFIYLLSEVGVIVLYVFQVGDQALYQWLYHTIFQPLGDYRGSFLFAVWWMLMCWLVGYWMDRKRIYVKI